MKKFLILAASAALLLTGCQKNEMVVQSEGQDEISFQSYNAREMTKATTLQSGSFHVAAYYRTGSSVAVTSAENFFPSEKYTWNATSSCFESTPAHYWPVSGILDFYATMPDSTTVVPDTTLTFTALNGRTDFQAAALIGQSKDDSHTLSFGHKLTKVAFYIKGDQPGLRYSVTNVTLKAYGNGKYTMPTTSAGAGSWSSCSTIKSYPIQSDSTDYDNTFTKVGDDWYLIPVQNGTGDDKLQVSVTYAVYNGATKIASSKTVAVDLSSTSSIWGINNSIAYKLTISLPSSVSPITFTAETTDWVVVKEPIFLDGEFSVSESKKVKFTKGNLYWNGEEYKIEEKQTDFPDTWDANHVGHFYWTKDADDAYAQIYGVTGETLSDVNWAAEGKCDITVEDWEDLYCPSFYELEYMLKNRSDASSKYKCGVNVGGVTCLVVAPDSFSGTLASSYTLDQALENSLLCLPLCGSRQGDTISNIESNAMFISATAGTTGPTNSSVIFISSSDITTRGYGNSPKGAARSNGSFIRLVQTVPAQ